MDIEPLLRVEIFLISLMVEIGINIFKYIFKSGECDFNGIELVEEDDDTYYYLDFICSYRKDDDRDFAKEDFDTIKEYLNLIGYEILDMEYEYSGSLKYLERIFISKNR